jgi:pimeloyl-ACP methyl ester carboxylesterase
VVHGVEHALGAVKDWALTPYRRLAGNYGANLFVRPGQHSAEGDPPSKWGLKYDTVNFTSKDGTPLKGWYMPADQPTDKTIVLAHGHGGQMSDVLWRWAPWLHKAGYNLMAFDFRNSGGSGGDKTTMGFEERGDLDAAISQAQAKGAKHIAVMGLSMGAATALSQAADDKRIEAVVADCSFDTIKDAVASRVARNTFDLGPFKHLHFPLQKQVTRGVVEASEQLTGHTVGSKDGSLRSADPIHAMAELKDRPVFLIHGKDDDETLPEDSVNLAKADPNAELWLVPGAKHAESYSADRQAYQAKVLDFLKRSF